MKDGGWRMENGGWRKDGEWRMEICGRLPGISRRDRRLDPEGSMQVQRHALQNRG